MLIDVLEVIFYRNVLRGAGTSALTCGYGSSLVAAASGDLGTRVGSSAPKNTPCEPAGISKRLSFSAPFPSFLFLRLCSGFSLSPCSGFFPYIFVSFLGSAAASSLAPTMIAFPVFLCFECPVSSEC